MSLYGPTDSKWDPIVEQLRARVDRLRAAVRADDKVIARLQDERDRAKAEARRVKGEG